MSDQQVPDSADLASEFRVAEGQPEIIMARRLTGRCSIRLGSGRLRPWRSSVLTT
ncbi:hypothetical protein NKG94_01135 [Micromonospora sp. M12]